MSIARARALRKAMTVPEIVLWSQLKGRRQEFRFRRQAPIGPYYADFACFDPKLIVEVDGSHHGAEEQQRHDAIRDAWFQEQGFAVLRYWARDVLANLEGVLGGIWSMAHELKAKQK